MKVWTTKGRRVVIIVGIFLMLAAPASALASVQCTEVMYDAPGNDTGREWIEITNTGTSSVDVTGYKLFESGINHTLTLAQGTSTLVTGESAIITDNPTKFLTDYPVYAGVIFKSPFSLLNTSGSFALKDKTLAIVDFVSYSSGMGAAGDGNSLHLSGTSWIPGAPNPSSNAPTQAIVKIAPTSPTTSVSKTVAVKTTAKTSSNTVKNSAKNSASSVLGAKPLVNNISPLWLSVLGCVSFMLLVVAAVLYVRDGRPKPRNETDSAAAEFEIE